jgi:hypothetical protein
MLEYFILGPTPSDEDCAQVGDDDFRNRATNEMNAYVNQLNRMFPNAVEKGISFSKKWFSHDFGTYGEVVAYYNDDSDYSFLLDVEMNLPYTWDEEALKELGVS